MGVARFKLDYPPGMGGHIQVARESRGMSQKELAKEAAACANVVTDRKRRALATDLLGQIMQAERTGGSVDEAALALIAEATHYPPNFFTQPTPATRPAIGFIHATFVKPCAVCGCAADYLCDFPMGEGKTCDLLICDAHAIRQGGDLIEIDFCPAHSIIARGVAT